MISTLLISTIDLSSTNNQIDSSPKLNLQTTFDEVSASATVNSVINALSLHWLVIFIAFRCHKSPNQSWYLTCLEQLLANNLVMDASTQIIKFADRKLIESISDISPKSRSYIFQNRLRFSCQTVLRNPLILATRLALCSPLGPSFFSIIDREVHTSSSSSSSSSTEVSPSDNSASSAVVAAVTVIVRIAPRWGLQRATGCTSLAIVCGQTSSSVENLEDLEDPSNSPISSTQLTLVRALSLYCCSALTIPDPAGLLPLQAALKNCYWDVARHIYTCYPYTVPLQDSYRRSAIYYALSTHRNNSSSTSSNISNNISFFSEKIKFERCVLELTHIYPYGVSRLHRDLLENHYSLSPSLLESVTSIFTQYCDRVISLPPQSDKKDETIVQRDSSNQLSVEGKKSRKRNKASVVEEETSDAAASVLLLLMASEGRVL